jgi:hypothetical protein
MLVFAGHGEFEDVLWGGFGDWFLLSASADGSYAGVSVLGH